MQSRSIVNSLPHQGRKTLKETRTQVIGLSSTSIHSPVRFLISFPPSLLVRLFQFFKLVHLVHKCILRVWMANRPHGLGRNTMAINSFLLRGRILRERISLTPEIYLAPSTQVSYQVLSYIPFFSLNIVNTSILYYIFDNFYSWLCRGHRVHHQPKMNYRNLT